MSTLLFSLGMRSDSTSSPLSPLSSPILISASTVATTMGLLLVAVDFLGTIWALQERRLSTVFHAATSVVGSLVVSLVYCLLVVGICGGWTRKLMGNVASQPETMLFARNGYARTTVEESHGGTVASSPSLPLVTLFVLPETEMGHREG
ncbi:hypothetical protein C4D60_Mb07t01380 [Musa balbisiana]|uniref:Uncharacterized protein n=1 Tax=Musa balbisiana TaxID=52838 RepID=A0A4S8JE03_MUSBA|nr:hypothetical protein C4D60_Mb07t01380 [Musa balbisiana]